MGSSQELHAFTVFLSGGGMNNQISDNVMGCEILKQKCACGRSCKIIWESLSMKMSKN